VTSADLAVAFARLAAGVDPDEGWRDRLVELHVLTASGDCDAATTAARWLATDDEARRVWEDVQRACDRVCGGL